MMMASSQSQRRPKVMFMTGAPSLQELDGKQLLNELQPPIRRFVDGATSDELLDSTPSSDWPSWRRLASDRRATETVEAELSRGNEQLSFLSVASPLDPEVLNYDFLEQSLIAFTHDEKSGDVTDTLDESTFLDESFLSEITEGSYVAPLEPSRVRFPSSVASLASLPKAETIERCYPQTITEDLLVGIISVAAPKIVHIPRFGNARRLVEVVVGDETKTGFPVKFWLPAANKLAVSLLEQNLMALRSNQVVLMTNISMRVYRGNVYGQSLSNQDGKATATNIVRLDENGRANSTLSPMLMKKRDRVQDWMFDFLYVTDRQAAPPQTPALNAKKRGYQALVDGSQLPPDTL